MEGKDYENRRVLCHVIQTRAEARLGTEAIWYLPFCQREEDGDNDGDSPNLGLSRVFHVLFFRQTWYSLTRPLLPYPDRCISG